MQTKNVVFAVLLTQLFLIGVAAPLTGMPLFCLITANGEAYWLGTLVMYGIGIALAYGASRIKP